MTELKDYIKYQKLTGETDKDIIIQYFQDNGIEEEMMEICYKLANAKVQKMKERLSFVNEWAYRLPSEYLYNNYSVDVATKLHQIELEFIAKGCVTATRLEWAKENIPHIIQPKVYFVPCMEWLEKNGIRFADFQISAEE